jgi:hypothetical protein
MSPYVRLPAYRAPDRLDFRQLNQGIEALGEGIKQNRLLEQRQEIGEALQSGDYGQGAQTAFGQGNIETGLALPKTSLRREVSLHARRAREIGFRR